MLTFNDILRAEHIDPAHVRLARHEAQRIGAGGLYAVWRDAARRDLFEQYQRVQRRHVFPVGSFVASFVVTPRPRRATLFVGLYNVAAVRENVEVDSPIDRKRFTGYLYDLTLDATLGDYRRRLSIEWGAATRTWVQRADRQDKSVVAIETHDEPPWPGFARFYVDIDEVPGLYDSWQQVLRTVKGVYLLVDVATGERYIGSAKGEDSLLGRFLAYAENGHGGNIELKKRQNARYRVSLLEVDDLSLPDKRIEEIESIWKAKVMTRQYGLNRN